MAKLGYMLKPYEAKALRDCAESAGALMVFLNEIEPRVFIGSPRQGVEPFRLIVKIGKDERDGMTVIARERLGLWPQVYFKFGPRCRVCGERLRDNERALGFEFAPDRRPDRTRRAYMHANPCGGGYVVESPFGDAYALASTASEAEARLAEGRRYHDDALASGHPRSAAWVAERSLNVRAISSEERERILLTQGTPLLDREP